MNRYALLIANMAPQRELECDIGNFTKFLKSDFGGQWLDSEICLKINPSKENLLAAIENIKAQDYDFVYSMFCGNSAYNDNGQCKFTHNLIFEFLDNKFAGEDIFWNMAKRQITIFDCPRKYDSDVKLKNKFSLPKVKNKIVDIRTKYEKRIMQAIKQQITLYSCKNGEEAINTESGGVYIQNLLNEAVIFETNEEFKLVGNVHEDAIKIIKEKKYAQNPQAILPKCLSIQQLIMSINPAYLEEI